MLYDIYTAIKNQLNTADTENILKGIEWYNVQYEGSIATTPRIFIEFPDKLNFDRISKDTKRTPVKTRLHVVSQAITENDGTIPDAVVQNHETIAHLALNAVDKFTPQKTGTDLTSPIQFSGWQHFHKHKGWMVTFVEFDAKKVL